MSPGVSSQIIKIGGAVIIIAAFLIVLPGFFSYFAGLARISIMILLTFFSAAASAGLYMKIAKWRKLQKQVKNAPASSGETPSDSSKGGKMPILLLPLIFYCLMLHPAQAELNGSQGRLILIPAGTTLEGRINVSIGSEISRQGQPFMLNIASPVLANGADIVIPVGAEIMGEVVEAIPSSRVQREKHEPKKPGKLRVQISGLRMPDGTTYPLVASFIGDTVLGTTGGAGPKIANPNLGGGVAYMASQSGFNAVYPHRRGQIVSKGQMMNDPLMGDPGRSPGITGGSTIGAIEKKHRDIVIPHGAALNIRLDAPLRLAVMPVPGAVPAVSPQLESKDGLIRRFSRPDLAPPVSPASTTAPPPSAVTPLMLPPANSSAEPLPANLATPSAVGNSTVPANTAMPQSPYALHSQPLSNSTAPRQLNGGRQESNF